MNKPTYKEQFDKITSAYFRNELDPGRCCACFIGNMLNNSTEWANLRTTGDGGKIVAKSNCSSKLDKVFGFYTGSEIAKLENNFLDIAWRVLDDEEEEEENLFAAMDSTLDMLRKIHESKGEATEPIPFTKRQLKTV